MAYPVNANRAQNDQAFSPTLYRKEQEVTDPRIIRLYTPYIDFCKNILELVQTYFTEIWPIVSQIQDEEERRIIRRGAMTEIESLLNELEKAEYQKIVQWSHHQSSRRQHGEGGGGQALPPQRPQPSRSQHLSQQQQATFLALPAPKIEISHKAYPVDQNTRKRLKLGTIEQIQTFNRQLQRRKKHNIQLLQTNMIDMFPYIVQKSRGYEWVCLVDLNNIGFKMDKTDFAERNSMQYADDLQRWILQNTRLNTRLPSDPKNIFWIIIGQQNWDPSSPTIVFQDTQTNMIYLFVPCVIDDHDCSDTRLSVRNNPMDDVVLLNLYAYFSQCRKHEASARKRLRSEIISQTTTDVRSANKHLQWLNDPRNKIPSGSIASFDGFLDYDWSFV